MEPIEKRELHKPYVKCWICGRELSEADEVRVEDLKKGIVPEVSYIKIGDFSPHICFVCGAFIKQEALVSLRNLIEKMLDEIPEHIATFEDDVAIDEPILEAMKKTRRLKGE